VSSAPPSDPGICHCCNGRTDLVRDLHVFWQPRPGYGYGADGRSITLCGPCIDTLQWFVELPGPPPS
jgi:hypothetical protein